MISPVVEHWKTLLASLAVLLMAAAPTPVGSAQPSALVLGPDAADFWSEWFHVLGERGIW